MQVVRNLYPHMFREMALGRDRFTAEIRALRQEFRQRHKNVLISERCLKTMAYAPATRRQHEDDVAFDRGSLRLILERVRYLRHSLKLVDGILYDGGVDDGSNGRRGRADTPDSDRGLRMTK